MGIESRSPALSDSDMMTEWYAQDGNATVGADFAADHWDRLSLGRE